MMKITKEWLKERDACIEGIDWFEAQTECEPIPLVKTLVSDNHWKWANWLIVRVMSYNQCISYAVFAAEQVIEIYEKEYPRDDRPRKAILAAKACIENPSEENKRAAHAAAYDAAYAAAHDAAYAAAHAAYAAADAAYAAAYAAAHDAAYATAYAAYAAAAHAHDAAYDAAYAAAHDAAYATAYAAYAAATRTKLRQQITEYGIGLLEKEG